MKDSTELSEDNGDEVCKWLETVDDNMYEFSSKLQKAMIYHPGTKGKMMAAKLLQPVFDDLKASQDERERLINIIQQIVEYARCGFKYNHPNLDLPDHIKEALKIKQNP